MLGPWGEGDKTQGYQSRLTPAQLYRTAIKAIDDHCRKAFGGRVFHELGSDQQDSVLTGLEKGEIKLAGLGPHGLEIEGVKSDTFFAQFLQNTIEGFFLIRSMAATRTWSAGSSSAFPARATTIARTSPNTAKNSTWLRSASRAVRGGIPWLRTIDMKLPPVDVVLVGFGWTAAMLGQELTDSGLNVLAIERGGWRDTSTDFAVTFAQDELRYMWRRALFQEPARETLTFRNTPSQTALPMRHLGSFLPASGVGGAGIHWNGQTWRFLPSDFVARSHNEQRYGQLPAGHDRSGLGRHLRRA